jgi:hypothetical protein
MAYLKHPELGNKHVPDSEVDRLTSEGWVKWPRTKEQKAGISPVKLTTDEFIAAVVEDAKPKRKYTRKA